MHFDIYLGDCLEILKHIPENSVDCILCDLPYGVTQNRWDIVIPLEDYIAINVKGKEKHYNMQDFLLYSFQQGFNYRDSKQYFEEHKQLGLWSLYHKVLKDRGVVILFGQGSFTTNLIHSNVAEHRYNLIWDKCSTTGFLNANRMPMRKHEDIIVFYKTLPVYNPQKFEGKSPSHKRCKKGARLEDSAIYNGNYANYFVGDYNLELTESNLKYPTSIISIPKVPVAKCIHPTQKPVELMEYLVKTYTNKGAKILDNCMGVGTTGIACANTNRDFIGIEKNEKYYSFAVECLTKSLPQSSILHRHDQKDIISMNDLKLNANQLDF